MNMVKRFNILSRKKIFAFEDKFSIVEVQIEFNGKKHSFGLRESPPFSVIIPKLDDKHFIMIHQQRLGADKISLEFPMGSVKGKDPLQTAIVELKEETGYRSDKLTHLVSSLFTSPGWSDQKASVFVAEELIKGEQEPEPYENIEVVTVKINDVDDLIKKGAIFDMTTIASFHCYKSFFGKSSVNIREK